MLEKLPMSEIMAIMVPLCLSIVLHFAGKVIAWSQRRAIRKGDARWAEVLSALRAGIDEAHEDFGRVWRAEIAEHCATPTDASDTAVPARKLTEMQRTKLRTHAIAAAETILAERGINLREAARSGQELHSLIKTLVRRRKREG